MPAVHRFSEEYPPIRITYDALTTMLDRVRGAIARANPPQDVASRRRVVTESLQVYRGRYSVTLDHGFEMADLAQAPSPADSLAYHYVAVESPISEVEVQLSDYARTVKVRGTDKNAVQDLHTILDSVLRTSAARIGGTRLRAMIEGFSFLLGISIAMGALANVARHPSVSIPIVLVGAAFMWLGTGDRLNAALPGFFLVRGDVSFARRYSAEIGFYGLVLGVVGLVLTIALAVRDHPKAETGGTGAASTEQAPKPTQ